jgi:Protein of unknown function (DUF3455)
MRTYVQHAVLSAVGVTALILTSSMSLSVPAFAGDKPTLTPPVVPPAIAVPPGNTAYILGHATGTQGYICLPAGDSFAWSKTGSLSGPSNNSRPDAVLLTDNMRENITHFLSPNPQETSPNPSENGQPHPTWQSVGDASAVWGNKLGSINAGTDPSCPSAGAISCLLLQVVGAQAGPKGGTHLSVATYIQRLNTTGGSAPPSPQTGCAECCAASTDVGNQLLVPYTADYWFYKSSQ